MVNNHYLEEICLKGLNDIRKSQKEDVLKIQEWLNLWRFVSAEWTLVVDVDGVFGPQTESAVRKFQRFRDERIPQLTLIEANGVVDDQTFQKLCLPMINAFRSDYEYRFIKEQITEEGIRKQIVNVAYRHLQSRPRELFNDNIGPWVRAYMKGQQGVLQYWCQGAVRTIQDQAFSMYKKDFRIFFSDTVSCDTAGYFAEENGRLLRKENIDLSKVDQFVKPGDQFLRRKSYHDWTHTGIVTKVTGTLIESCEGNTNDDGNRNGYEYCRRERNLEHETLDFIILPKELK